MPASFHVTRPGPRLFLSLFLMLALVACSENESSTAKYLESAQEFKQKGNLPAAIIQLKSAVQSAPDSQLARRELGLVYLTIRDGESAKKEITKAVELGFPAADAEPLLIEALLYSGVADKALERAKLADQATPSPRFKVLQGNAALALGQIDAAKPLFEAVLKAEPKNADALTGLAKIAFAKEDYATAEALVQQALVLAPNNYDAHLINGELLLTKRDFAGASAAFDRASKQNPYTGVPLFAKVRVNLEQKDYASANKILGELKLRLPKNLLVPYYQGVVSYASGQAKEAIDYFRGILSQAPNHSMSQFYLGMLLYKQGNLEQAEDLLLRVTQANPDYVPAIKLLTTIQVQRDKPQAALKTLNAINTDLTDDPQLLALAGRTELRAGNFDKGLDLLSKAVSLAPKDQLLKTTLVFAQLQLGKQAEAVSKLESDIQLEDATSSGMLLMFVHVRNKDWDKALALGNELLAKDQDDPIILNTMAMAYLGKGDEAAARAALNRVIDKHPEFSAAQKNLATLDSVKKDYAAAEQHARKLLETQPKDTDALTMLGQIYGEQHENAEAVKYLEQARAADPRAVEARTRLSNLYLEQKDYKSALAVAKEAAGIAQNNVTALTLLGFALMYSDNLSEAQKVAEYSDKLFPGAPNVQLLKGMVELRRGAVDAAEIHFEQVLKAVPDHPDALLSLARVQIAKGQLAQAAPLVEKLQHVEPDSQRLSVLQGDLAAAKGEFAQAIGHYEQALAKAHDTPALIKLYQARVKQGQAARALTELETAAKVHPEDIPLLVTLAQAYAGGNRVGEAISLYETALKHQPQAPVLLNNMALLKDQRGDAAAADFAEKAYNLSPENPAIADTYGMLLVRRGHSEQGLKVLESALAKMPDSPEIRYHYAEALARNGQNAVAITELKKALEGGRQFDTRAKAEALLGKLTPPGK